MADPERAPHPLQALRKADPRSASGTAAKKATKDGGTVLLEFSHSKCGWVVVDVLHRASAASLGTL